ncbi:MAG: GreA/GreB family elongation factor [Gaiellaceae bacterium]
MKAARVVDDVLITAEGYERLRSELERLRAEGRRDMSERLREARADGHLDDNPGLFDTLEEQIQLERRIALLEARLAAARIAEPNGDGSAGIGSSVRLRDLETGELVEYELVGAIEGNVARGRVSVDAPVGRAMVGAAAGEVVSVACPRGELRFEVIGVDAASRGATARMAA